MDYTYRERHGEAIYRFKSLPSRGTGEVRPRGKPRCHRLQSAASGHPGHWSLASTRVFAV
jgi:hypothetical protein